MQTQPTWKASSTGLHLKYSIFCKASKSAMTSWMRSGEVAARTRVVSVLWKNPLLFVAFAGGVPRTRGGRMCAKWVERREEKRREAKRKLEDCLRRELNGKIMQTEKNWLTLQHTCQYCFAACEQSLAVRFIVVVVIISIIIIVIIIICISAEDTSANRGTLCVERYCITLVSRGWGMSNRDKSGLHNALGPIQVV